MAAGDSVRLVRRFPQKVGWVSGHHGVGHADLRMIIRYYTLRDDESQDAMEALAAGEDSSRVCTDLAHSGGREKTPRSQPPRFRVVTTAGWLNGGPKAETVASLQSFILTSGP